MKKFISLSTVAILLISAVSSWVPMVEAAAKKENCENGECFPKLVNRLEDVGALYKKQCLPNGIKNEHIEKYHQENGITEECWKFITEINHLETELLAHQNKLESRLGCESGDCRFSSSGDSLNSQISQFSKVEESLSCSGSNKQAITNQCHSDMNCVLASTAMGMGGYLAELIVPAKAKPKGCHLGNDSCVTQLATGFLISAITFFEGAWDLLKIIGKKTGETMKKFWNWVSGAENHSSTSQLAMAKASKDKGVFDMLINDFPGTMKNVWGAFVGSIKEWMKSKVFCQKWSGVPQFSECLAPTNSFDCIPCKTMLTGLCSITGTIVAEVVPAFLTGGLLTAAKHGVNGAAKIAKVFKISKAGISAVQASRVGKIALQTSNKVDDAFRLTKSLRTANNASLAAINTYLISPTRKLLKTSFTVLSNSMKKTGGFIAETAAGKVLIFSGKTLKTTGKVILYPIDNPLTTFAYKSGSRSFDELFKFGLPVLGTKTVVTSSLIQKNGQMETVLAKLQKAKMASRPDAKEILRLEEELITNISPYRSDFVKSALNNSEADFSDVIAHLYPELQYGDLAKKLPKEKVIQAENDLFIEIQRLPEGAPKTAALKRYEAHLAIGEMRMSVLGDTKSPFDPQIKITPEKAQAQAKFNKPLTEAEVELKATITSYAENTQDQLLAKGAQIEKMLLASKEPKVYDVIAIGAGPNNGVAVSVLKETNPNLSVLVIESTESMGTFNKLKGFDINTPEFIGNSGNTFPGTPVQLRDLNISDASFASAEDLGSLTVMTYKSADTDMIFNNKVINWTKEPTPGSWPAKYKIETSNGVTVYANAGLAGTGFGPPITRLKDPASIALVTKYEDEIKALDLVINAFYIPKATSVDDFLTIAAKDVKAGRQAVARYKGKKVLIIGSGDGGNIAVEATAGLNKQLNPSGLNTEIQTVWLGQEFPTGDAFLKSLSTRKNLRYSRIAEAMDNGKIKSVNGYLARVEEFVNEAGEKQFKAFYTTKDGAAIGDPLIVDNLVFATGYPNNHSTLNPVFKNMTGKGNVTGDEISFEALNGRVDDFTRYEEFKTASEITKQLTINGEAEDIYATGAFARMNVTDAEWKVPTGGFIDINAPKSAATGKLIAQKLSPQSLTRSQAHKLLTPLAGEKIQVIKRPLRLTNPMPGLPNTFVADMHTKIELGKSLRAFNSKPNTNFIISISKGKKGNFVYNVSGLDKKASEEIAQALSNNAQLTHGIDGGFQLGRTILDIQVKTRGTGMISLENLSFTPKSNALTVPIFVPMNITGGTNKFLSPGIKTIENPDDERRKKEAVLKQLQ